MHGYLSARRVSRQDVSIPQSRVRSKKNRYSFSQYALTTRSTLVYNTLIVVHETCNTKNGTETASRRCAGFACTRPLIGVELPVACRNSARGKFHVLQLMYYRQM